VDPLLSQAEAHLQRLVDATTDEQLGLPSPCDGWSVRDLLNHVVGGAVRYRLLLEDAPEELIAGTRTADHLGPDPAASLRDKARVLSSAFAAPEAGARIVHHRAGDITGDQLRTLRVVECTMHGWDLATATGQDPTIPDELAGEVIAATGRIDMLRGQGFFAPPPADVSDDRAVAVLQLTGRA